MPLHYTSSDSYGCGGRPRSRGDARLAMSRPGKAAGSEEEDEAGRVDEEKSDEELGAGAALTGEGAGAEKDGSALVLLLASEAFAFQIR